MSALRLVPGVGLGSGGDDPDMSAHLDWGRNIRGLSPRTLHAREWVLRRIRTTAGVPLREVTEEHLLTWERVDVAGRAPETRRTYIAHAASFYRWLVQTKVIRRTPTEVLTRPKTTKPLPNPIGEDELRMAIFCAAPKMAAMLTLAAYAGLRAMEIAQLQWQDIRTTVDGRTVIDVRQGKGGKDRVVPVGKVVLEALREHGGRGRGPVFMGRDGRQLNANSVSTIVNGHLRRLGIASSVHKLRHRYATVSAPLLDNDLSLLAQLCGWNSLETAKHYVLPDPRRANKLVEALDELAGGDNAQPATPAHPRRRARAAGEQPSHQVAQR